MRINIRRAAVGAMAMALVFAWNGGHALANHVRCGDTITQNTTLDSDLGCSGSAPGIRLGGHAVTLDLNGHLLTHNGSGPGIENPGFDDETIQNGAVRTENSDGIVLDDADRNTLRGLQVVRVLGGDTAPMPVVLTGSDDALIEGNGFFGWTGALRVTQSDRGVIRGNRTGYFLCALIGDCASFATGGGVGLTASDDSLVEGNSFSQGISGYGNGSDRNVFRRNSITYSIGVGLFLSGGEDNATYRNTVSHNAFNGIGAPAGPRTRIEKNNLSDNGGSGIVVSGASTLISHNVAERNRDDGIHVSGPGVIVEKNRANDNRDLGIEADPGVVDGGGNKASGNGNPAQCVNVACK
jgi:parallel beta-helix repeat protein